MHPIPDIIILTAFSVGLVRGFFCEPRDFHCMVISRPGMAIMGATLSTMGVLTGHLIWEGCGKLFDDAMKLLSG